ncbi:MAG: Gfo/Idh/MocA family protein [Bythopirellula sp.]
MPSLQPFTRRQFIATTAATVAATSLAGQQSALAKDIADIRVAVIGVKGRGRAHVSELGKNVVAVCDVDEKILQERAAKFQQDLGHELETFTDYRQLLDRKDIDAVSIATPNHTHALITVAAAKAGKDVYVEKPVAHNIWEGRQMVAAAKKYGRIIQCGTQSRSSRNLQAAVKFIRDGGLGQIEYALGTCYKPRQSIGQLNAPLKIPTSIDYDLWCGPAEARDLYRPQLHYDWHWDFNTGNGDMGNQGIHQMDISRWFLGEQKLAPRVISIGGRLGYEDAGDTPNTQVVYHDYEAAPLIFETRGLPRSKVAQENWRESMDSYRGSGVGVIIQCEGGHVFVPSYREAIVYDRAGKVVQHWKDGGNPHHANWLQAVAAQDAALLTGHILEGHLSSSLCHLGGISHQLGEKQSAREIANSVASNERLSASFDRMAGHLRANDVDIDSDDGALTLGPWLELDPATERFTDNEAANGLRQRSQQRAAHAVPELEGNGVLAKS